MAFARISKRLSYYAFSATFGTITWNLKAKSLGYCYDSTTTTATTTATPAAAAAADQSSDEREISFLFQRLSVLIQRYNALLLHDCFVKEEE